MSCCCLPQSQNTGSKRDKYVSADVLQFFSGGKVSDKETLSQLMTQSANPPVEQNIPLVTDANFLQTLDEIFIESVEFMAFDFSPDNFGELINGLYQPNFFQPKIRVNGANLLNVSNSIVGIPLPYCYSVNKIVKNPKTIEIVATYAKMKDSLYTSYPIQALMTIYHNE